MSKRYFTAQEIYGVYDQIENGAFDLWSIARSLDVNISGVNQIYKNIKKYVFHFEDLGKKNKNYCEARKMILRANEMKEIPYPSSIILASGATENARGVDEIKSNPADTTLEELLNKLPGAIEDFVVAQVTERTKAIQEENQVLREAIDSAKLGNAVVNINKRLNGII